MHSNMKKEKQKTISVESIDKVLKYLSIFEKKEYRNKEVNEFVETLYEEGFIIPFDWPDWQSQAEQFYSKPELLNDADIVTLQKLFTTHVRKDRFCEGHLNCVLEDGHITAILRQLKDIRKKTMKSLTNEKTAPGKDLRL